MNEAPHRAIRLTKPSARQAGAWIVLALLLAAGNVFRAATWTQTGGFVWGPFAGPATEDAVAVNALGRLDVATQAWRPLRVTLALQPVSTDAVRLALSLDPGNPGVFEAVAGPSTRAILAGAPRPGTDRITVWAATATRAPVPQVRLSVIAREPVFTAGSVAFHALIGLGAGFLLGLLLWPPRAAAATRSPTVEGQPAGPGTTRAQLVVTGVLAAFFALWAVAKPPLQSPDEVQHHVRATELPRLPWVCGSVSFALPPSRVRNPLTFNQNALHPPITNVEVKITAAQLAELKRVPWWPESAFPPGQSIVTGICSYPPLYYWTVFGLGEAASRAFGLGPYASIVAYRLVTAVVSALLWGFVYRVLSSLPETRGHAVPLLAFMTLNPMLATMASTINPDAVNIASIVLMFVSAWAYLAHGRCWTVFRLALWVAIASKPSGVLALMALLAVVTVSLRWPWTTTARVWQLGRWSLASALVAWLIFYAWSPPRLSPIDGAFAVPLAPYLASLFERAPKLWTEYWGKLGWLEYRLPDPWHWAMLVLLAASAVVAFVQRVASRAFVSFVWAVCGAFVLMLIVAEFANRAQGGLVMQGRYLLPASLALATAVLHRTRVTRFVLPTYLVVLNVALLQLTLQRYLGGDAAAVRELLLFWTR